MDYSNFIRNVYRTATNELKKYVEYNGRIVNVGKPIGIPREFMHREDNRSLFMPRESVNIDAPSKYFVEFMDYYVSMMPELGIVFADKSRIGNLYKTAADLGVLDDDDKAFRYITAVVSIGVRSLEQAGVLQNG